MLAISLFNLFLLVMLFRAGFWAFRLYARVHHPQLHQAIEEDADRRRERHRQLAAGLVGFARLFRRD